MTEENSNSNNVSNNKKPEYRMYTLMLEHAEDDAQDDDCDQQARRAWRAWVAPRAAAAVVLVFVVTVAINVSICLSMYLAAAAAALGVELLFEYRTSCFFFVVIIISAEARPLFRSFFSIFLPNLYSILFRYRPLPLTDTSYSMITP